MTNDEEAIVDELDRMPTSHNVAFATAVAERMFSALAAYAASAPARIG